MARIPEEEIIGFKYNMLTITGEAPKRTNSKLRRIKYVCDCGKTGETNLSAVRANRIKSCGCFKFTHAKTHGLSGTRLYTTWEGMKDRCYNKNRPGYCNYGGRGIKVISTWRDNFESFYEWAMFSGYNDTLTIERKDINGDYEPDNCCWIPKSQQCLNRRVRTDNQVGITGVHYCKYKNAWVASWKENGKVMCKRFPEKKFGADTAKKLAIEARRNVENRLGITNNTKRGENSET